jgi:hypothetical protein
VITTNRGVGSWGELTGDNTGAAAMLTDSCTARSCSTSTAIRTPYETTTPEHRNSAERPPEPDNHYSEGRSQVGNFIEHN